MPAIIAETDLLPDRLFEDSDDWTGTLVTRQLSRPLFTEGRDGDVYGDLIADVRRLSACRWQLTVRDDACWSNGRRLTAADVVSQVRRVAGARRLPFLVGLLRSIGATDTTTLLVDTQVPMGRLAPVLANPLLGPRSTEPEVSSGAYLRTEQPTDDRHLTLSSTGGHPNLVLRRSDNALEGQQAYEAGTVDITCPTTLPVGLHHRETADLHRHPLHVAVGLLPPAGTPPTARRALSGLLDRRALCAALNDVVEPLALATAMWRSDVAGVDTGVDAAAADELAALGSLRTRSWPLHYPDFSPNAKLCRLVAEALREAAGIELEPRTVSYTDYRGHSPRLMRGFRLVLWAAPWPDPISVLAPQHHASRSGPSTEARSAVEQALAAEDPHEVRKRARTAETLMAYAPPPGVELPIVLGALRSLTRTRLLEFDPPPSGWIDFSRCRPATPRDPTSHAASPITEA